MLGDENVDFTLSNFIAHSVESPFRPPSSIELFCDIAPPHIPIEMPTIERTIASCNGHGRHRPAHVAFHWEIEHADKELRCGN